MGTPDQSWLKPGEAVIYRSRQRFRDALIYPMAISAGTAIAIAAIAHYDVGDLANFGLIIAAMIGISEALSNFVIRYRRFELVLTSNRLIHLSGWYWRRRNEFTVADIAEILGPRSGNYPFELKLADGKTLSVQGLPDLGRLRDTLAKEIGAA